MTRFGISGTARASVALYNNRDDVVQTSYLYPRNYGLRVKVNF